MGRDSAESRSRFVVIDEIEEIDEMGGWPPGGDEATTFLVCLSTLVEQVSKGARASSV